MMSKRASAREQRKVGVLLRMTYGHVLAATPHPSSAYACNRMKEGEYYVVACMSR